MHKVAVIVGSIRKDSKNKELAKALAKLAEGKLDFQTIRIDDLPLFNQDDESAPSPPVQRFKQEVEGCDAVLFVTPEHNRSVPAAMKNAFDWGSRPPGKNSWRGKPAAITGTSGGRISTALAQLNMRTMASGHFSVLLNSPEVFLQFRDDLFDDDDNVRDEDTKKFLQTFIDSFAKLVDAVAGK